jgi:hypothetical protein
MSDIDLLHEEPPAYGGGGKPSPILEYLPAQKWLKDRIGRTLGYDEREEYCRIIWALLETQRLMGEIDKSIEAHGGWPLK